MQRLFFLILLITSIGFAQTTSFEKGKILDKLPVKNTQETYAAYIPKSFHPDALTGIVFIFDPSGVGRQGIQVFTDAAEKYNYVLICSNVTKNGVPYETNFQVTNRLFETVFAIFNIDKNQIYTAGFSGGSRLATAIASLTNKIQGVIACGAGLSINKSFTPNKEMFSFVGLIGDEDMNYQEMFTTKAWLDKFDVDNELFVYNDTHRWPPKEQINRAFGWLELQAYKKKIRPVNNDFVDTFYASQLKNADSLAKHNNTFRGLLEYKSIAKNFKPYKSVDVITAKIEALKNSEKYQSEVRNRKENLALEDKIYEKFSTVYSKDILKAKSDDNFQWWRRELKQLDNMIATETNHDRLKMYKRLKYTLFAGAYESSMAYIGAGKHKHALYCDRLLVYFNPTQAYWYYRLAQSYTRNDNFNKVIKNLKKAKELGLQNFNGIKNAPLFAKYAKKRRFLKLFDAS